MIAPETIALEGEAVPVTADPDVVVCGGGPAGIGAAVAAAREGASTLLVEALQHLGGLATSHRLSTMCDSPGGSIYDELIGRLMALDAAWYRDNPERYYPPGRTSYRREMFKAVAAEMVDEAGMDVLFGTVAESAWLDDGAARGVLIVNKAGRSLVRARVVIDCTADADIAASAGAPFVQGDPEDGRIQHCNFAWRIGGVDPSRLDSQGPDAAQFEQICRDAVAAGEVTPPHGLFGIDPAAFPWSAEREAIAHSWELQGIDPTDPRQTSRALMQSQRAALQIVRMLRERVPGYEECVIAKIATVLGTRESRRIVGAYTLTREDVLSGAKFDDGVVPAWFWLDLHDPPPGRSTPYPLEYVQANRPARGDWYEVPYRCLLPTQPPGLLVAGRCISCDRPAQGSLRVMPTCMYIGEAAGAAAARAVKVRVDPHEVDGRELKAGLRRR